MGPKHKSKTPSKSSGYMDSFYAEEDVPTRLVELTLTLKSQILVENTTAAKKTPADWNLLLMFEGKVLLNMKWEDDKTIQYSFPYNLLDPYCERLIVEQPLVLLLRSSSGKAGKDPDPLTHPDNRAGGTVDLMPLVMGADDVNVKVRLLTPTGAEIGFKVKVFATAVGSAVEHNMVPLVLTMISAHCFPNVKEGTVYISAIGLDGLVDNMSIQLGTSLSSASATNLVLSSVCTGGLMMNSAYKVPDDDKFIPLDLETKTNQFCNSVYWNTVNRVLVDPFALRTRLYTSFSIELAGVARFGKTDVRGRYMGLIDARALLHPSQTTLIACAKLQHFVEGDLPEGIGPLLDLPPVSQKSTARSPAGVCNDAQGHAPYVVMRFDLKEPLVPKDNLVDLFQTIGFPVPQTRAHLNELHVDPPPEDIAVDARKIRHECGALAVHKELSTLACRGAVPMNQGIKRTAANRLLMRVRTMLKQFSPGECLYIDWQDTATGQHAAARRAVTASFCPQPPPKRVSGILTPARACMAGDMRIAKKHIENNLEANNKHPRILLAKALRCLEARNDTEASFYVLKCIDLQTRNRYLLWLLGGLKFDKGKESLEVAKSAFKIAVKGDYSDGIACTIGWAALHTLYHIEGDQYGAFVAAKKMRKSFELDRDWREYYQRWVDTSGEEEFFWIPSEISTENPLLITSAFFLCLRCYKFSELLLLCFEQECATRGSRFDLKTKFTEEVYYLRAASLLLRRQVQEALKLTEHAVKKYGPAAILSQMRATCLMAARGWDEDCALALAETDRSGAKTCSGLLLEAALKGMKVDLEMALQRAARAHKATPCAHTALVIARIYTRKAEFVLAEKWATAAVKLEPWLADAWAVLALLAMGDRDVEKARAMMRTAYQAGPISPDIESQLKKVMRSIKIETLADCMTKNLCFCDYFEPPKNN